MHVYVCTVLVCIYVYNMYSMSSTCVCVCVCVCLHVRAFPFLVRSLSFMSVRPSASVSFFVLAAMHKRPKAVHSSIIASSSEFAEALTAAPPSHHPTIPSQSPPPPLPERTQNSSRLPKALYRDSLPVSCFLRWGRSRFP